MMKKCLFIILLPFVLSSCMALGSYGYYEAEDSKDNVFKDIHTRLPYIFVPFFPDEPNDKKNIRIELPLAGKNCALLTVYVIPIPLCTRDFLDKEEKHFFVLIYGNIEPWNPIADSFTVFVKTQDGIMYQGKRTPPRVTEALLFLLK